MRGGVLTFKGHRALSPVYQSLVGEGQNTRDSMLNSGLTDDLRYHGQLRSRYDLDTKGEQRRSRFNRAERRLATRFLSRTVGVRK